MRWKSIKKDTAGLSKAMMAIIVVVLLLVSSSIAIVLTMGNSSSSDGVASGDTVTVNYTGTIMVQGEPKVFDTSIWDVASDNSTYLKAAWFAARAQSAYTAFSFQAGRGMVVIGFDQGVIGMKVGETKMIEIPPQQGYGNMVASKLTNFTITATSPIYVTTTPAAFTTTFGVGPTTGLTVTDPVNKWPVTVLNVDSVAGKVLYQNSPTLNAEYHVYGSTTAGVVAGWNITITSMDSTANGGEGLISYRHMIDESDSYDVRGYKGSSMFVLMDVDTTTGKAVMNFNDPLKGQTMTFKVTVVSIKK